MARPTDVLIKEIDYDAMKNQVTEIDFSGTGKQRKGTFRSRSSFAES